MPDQTTQENTSGNDLAGANVQTSDATTNTAIAAEEPSSNIVTDVAALKAQVESLHKLTDDQAEEIAALRSRLSSLESRAGSLETSVGTLSAASTDHDSTIRELKKLGSPLDDERLASLLNKYGLK